MNSSVKNNTEVIFQIFTSFLSSMSEKDFDMLLDKKAKLVLQYLDSDINNPAKLLEKIKLMDITKATSFLLDEIDDKEIFVSILKLLDVSATKNSKKETLVKKIINSVFEDKQNNAELENIKEQLLKIDNKAEAVKLLEKLKVAELKELAKILKISLPYKTKAQIVNCIVQRSIGNKINSEIILSTDIKRK